MGGFRGVVFDWRGTLVTTLGAESWVREALRLLGREHDLGSVTEVAAAIARAERALGFGAMEIDIGAEVHRDAYNALFAAAGLDTELSDALYVVESDPSYNHFAVDVRETLETVAAQDCQVAILSDIHFDLRPVFGAAGIRRYVDVFVLSYEHGVQKPDPAIFRIALDALGTDAEATLMVGDRATHDGAAVQLGMPALLLAPLTDPRHRRLHHVRALVRPAWESAG